MKRVPMHDNMHIKHLRQDYGAAGWTFTLEYTVGWPTTRTIREEWSTNKQGEGLFTGTKQQVGTSQFTLRGCTRDAAYARIRRHFSYPEPD